MSSSYRGSSGRGGSNRGDLPYRGGRGDGPRQGGGQAGGRGGSQGSYQGGGGGRGGSQGGRGGGRVSLPPPSDRMIQGDPKPSKAIEQFENIWIGGTGARVRPRAGDMATRPVYGTRGEPMIVRANYFDLNFNPNINFHTYTAKITPDPQPKRHLLLIWEHILDIPRIRNAFSASDNAYELVTVKSLGDVPPLPVKIPDGDRNPKIYSVVLTRTATLDPKAISDRLRDPSVRSGVEGEAVMVRLLNIVMAAYPGKDHGVITLGKGGNNKFFRIDKDKQSFDLGGGLECLRGFYASVRLAAGRVLLNLSVNHSAFYKPGPLQDLWNIYKANNSDLVSWARYIKGLRVECRHLKDDVTEKKKVPRVKTIWGLADSTDGSQEERRPVVPHFGADAHNVSFYMDGKKITVAEYFKQRYNITVQQGLPVVNVGSNGRPVYLPMDVLDIPEGRVFRGELSTAQRQSIISFSCRLPAHNYDSIIDNGLAIIGAKENNIKDYGIKVEPEMVAVPARILSAPTLKYAKDKQKPNRGSWNLIGKTFNKCAKITCWAGVVLWIGSTPPENAWKDFQEFGMGMQRCGMSVAGLMKEVIYIKLDKNHRENLPKIDGLFAKLKGYKLDLAVIVMPQGMDRVFDHIKWRGDTMDGVATLCCNFKGFFKNGDNKQYWANNAMKVNLRLGGVNQALELPASSLIATGRTMIVGLDVTHPSPTDPDTFPSIASIVASTDKTVAQWPGQVKIQERRKESVDNLAELIKARLQRWKKENRNVLPENIVVFRDGVSEGQYDMVLNTELPQIKDGCEKLYGDKSTHKQPNITVLVGGKRHNTRFFPIKNSDTDGKGNCRNGLVVDRVVTRPHLWDFYLQAQAPLQGSARSAHYVVIWDEIFINPTLVTQLGPNPADAIQELTHNICYMMGRCTRSISYSTPAFLADRFADRARKYVRAYYFQAQAMRGNRFPPAPPDQVTRLAPNLSETMVYI